MNEYGNKTYIVLNQDLLEEFGFEEEEYEKEECWIKKIDFMLCFLVKKSDSILRLETGGTDKFVKYLPDFYKIMDSLIKNNVIKEVRRYC